MRLLAGAWRVLVGIKDALVLIAMLLFFGALYAGLSLRPGTGTIRSGALVLKLNGSIVEQPETASLSALGSGQSVARQFRLRDLIAAIDAAAVDDRVKGVVLDLDGFTGGGQVALGDVGAALDTVRAKKPVYAYATGYSDDAYQLAAHATDIWLHPMGLALFQGPGGSHLYYKGLIDKLGVTAHVYRVGKYKSFVEPYIRADSSPDAKAAGQALAASLWQGWQADVIRARPKAQIAGYASDPVTATANGDLAKAALDAGIVDHLGDRTAFDAMLAAKFGPGHHDDPYAAIRMTPWMAAHPAPSGDGSIGIFTVAGTIEDGEAQPGTAGGDTIAAQIDRAVADGDVKALVVRIDSPGGSALAAERIRASLAAAKAHGLPIVISMSNVAASGGYWLATAGDKIFAEPATITGSIGVFGIIPSFEGTLAKAGVTSDGVTTTPLSGQPDITGGTNAAFDTIIQKSIESTYGRFIALVSGARRLPPARVNDIAQGRVWDGGSAHQLGLVDAFGGINDAIAEAARRAKLDPGTPHAVWLERPPGWSDTIAAMVSDDDASAPDLITMMARARENAVLGALSDARSLLSASVVQARCLECPASPRALRPVRPFFEMTLAWMMR